MPRESIGSYEPIPMDDVEGKSADWLKIALEIAGLDAKDIVDELERLYRDADKLSAQEVGQSIGELEERLAWLADLLRKAKLARYDSGYTAGRQIETLETDKL